jgi:hypothetical protein
MNNSRQNVKNMVGVLGNGYEGRTMYDQIMINKSTTNQYISIPVKERYCGGKTTCFPKSSKAVSKNFIGR